MIIQVAVKGIYRYYIGVERVEADIILCIVEANIQLLKKSYFCHVVIAAIK